MNGFLKRAAASEKRADSLDFQHQAGAPFGRRLGFGAKKDTVYQNNRVPLEEQSGVKEREVQQEKNGSGAAFVQNPAVFAGKIYMLDPNLICPNPHQPRKFFEDDAIIRLADSIRQFGILQPISVRPIKTNPAALSDGAISELTYPPKPVFELIAGERRLRAAKMLGMSALPCIIIDADDRKCASLAIIENIQRQDLNIFEQAGAIATLIDVYNLTQEQVACQLSSSQSYIANKLRILRLTSHEREIIIKNGLSERHARTLLRIEDIDERYKVLCHIAAKQMNVAASEEYIDRLLAEKEPVRSRGKHKFILKDIKLFYNSIEKALDLIRKTGIAVSSEKKELENGVEMVIRLKYRD